MSGIAEQTPRIRRRFVTIGDRQVHLRIAGSGPAVILLGQSPTSAQTLDHRTLAFAEHFTAIAIDTPGLGRSSPLNTPKPEVADQALALAELLDVMGVAQAGFFGSHTGASICLEFARRYPDRAVMTLLDGLPIYNNLERNMRLSTYFPEYSATWEGLHLMWLWYRYREQNVFWPWNIRGKGTRGRCDVPSPAHLHRGLVDILQVGMGYVAPYASVFRYRAEEAIPGLTSPVVFLAYPDDSLLPAMRHLPSLPERSEIVEMPEDRDKAVQKEIEILKSQGHWASAHLAPGAARCASGPTHDYVDLPLGQLAVSRFGADTAKPLVMLPPAPGSATQLETLPELLSGDREVITVDLPACGVSDPVPSIQYDFAGQAEAVADALAVLVDGPVDLYAKDGGACVALALAKQQPNRIGKLVLDNPPLLTPQERAEIAPRYADPIDVTWDGAYLVKLWHATRDQELYWPWYDRTREAVRDIDPEIDPDRLTTEVHAYLKNHEAYDGTWKTVLSHPLLEELRDYPGRVLLCASKNGKFHNHTRAVPNRDFRELPEARFAQAQLIREYLDMS